jgi:hypothetical protein
MIKKIAFIVVALSVSPAFAETYSVAVTIERAADYKKNLTVMYKTPAGLRTLLWGWHMNDKVTLTTSDDNIKNGLSFLYEVKGSSTAHACDNAEVPFLQNDKKLKSLKIRVGDRLCSISDEVYE